MMKKTNLAPPKMPVLNEGICYPLGEAVKPVALSNHRKESLRLRVLNRIDKELKPGNDLISTIRKNEGSWIRITAKLSKKQLFVNHQKGIETFLLKADPGAEIPGHFHDYDEFSMVLEGSIHFEDIQLNAGDYHIARKGSYHSDCICPDGALVYLQTALPQQANF